MVPKINNAKALNNIVKYELTFKVIMLLIAANNRVKQRK